MGVRYLFVADNIRKKEVKVDYCATEDVLGDHSSNPLQGVISVKQLNLIQDVKEQYFKVHKGWCRRVMEKYELWYNE